MSIQFTPFPEVCMLYPPTIPTPQSAPQLENRPFLDSFDSAREFNLDHWMEVSWLVEHEEEETEGYVFEDCLVTR
jgi:hypothetical protein